MNRNGDVLVVEDDKMLNDLMCRFVETTGHRVRSALDGASGLSAAQTQTPALVLLDLMLPDTTGFEVCLQLKSDDRTRSATVVMVTARGDDESRRRGLECGATEYVVKPFTPDQFIKLIEKYAA